MVPKMCSIEECHESHHSRGLCSSHYARWRRYGSATKGGAERPHGRTLEERFFSKVNKTDSCWVWTAAKDPAGYGRFGIGQKVYLAHRVSLDIAGIAIPDDMFADHTCHNKSCVNPAHLRAVTQKQNQENLTGARRTSASGVRGVSWDKRNKAWVAQIRHNGQNIFVGRFSSISDAHEAVSEKRRLLFTHNDMDRVALGSKFAAK